MKSGHTGVKPPFVTNLLCSLVNCCQVAGLVTVFNSSRCEKFSQSIDRPVDPPKTFIVTDICGGRDRLSLQP